MKKTTLSLLSLSLLLVISCGDDDSANIDLSAVDPDPNEEIILGEEDVSNNLIITGGTQMDGDAPQPNGTLAFTIDDQDQSAFQKNGFDITFERPAGYAGAYIQIQDNEGNTAPNYWDIPEFVGKNANIVSKKRNFLGTQNNKQLENDVSIDVDFNDVPAGRFCYLICIYDDNGNISEPAEICVEVEAWGGNDGLAGTWELYRSENFYDGISEVFEIDVESCYEYQFFCNATNTEVVVADGECSTLTLSDLVLRADGTYTYTSESSGSTIDYDASSNGNNCDPVLVDDNEDYSSSGNWAYDEEEEELTLVEFEFREDNDPIELSPNGYVIFSGSIRFDGSSNFTVESEDRFDGELETFKGYFRKK